MIESLYEPFRHWAATGSVYLLGDTHFDDADAHRMDPDMISVEEQLDIINSTVRKNDTFICLGDVGDPKYIPLINAGQKVLLLGNHDRKADYRDVFDEMYTGPLFIAEKILLSHEPVPGLPWCLNIHGHDHGNKTVFPDDCRHINLAANVCGYTPMNLKMIIKGGGMSEIPSIHRIAIDRAVANNEETAEATRYIEPPEELHKIRIDYDGLISYAKDKGMQPGDLSDEEKDRFILNSSIEEIKEIWKEHGLSWEALI